MSLAPNSETVVQTEEVFTPSTVARKTFVDRLHLGDRLRRELRVIGRPIALVGPYGCGKTTLALIEIERIFPRQIHIICKHSTTFEELLFDSMDVLGPYYNQEQTQKSTKVPTVGAEFMGFKAQLGGKSSEKGTKETRVVEAQLTSRSLARFAAAAEAPWIIDDIHKLADSEIIKVAEAMREWQTAVLDTGAPKMIVIGTEQVTEPLHSRLIKAAPDLNRRLASMKLSLMSDEELEEIILSGSRILNVDFSEIMQKIVRWSYGYPGICHDLCYHVCYAAEVFMTSEVRLKFSAHDLQSALKAYMEDCCPTIQDAFRLIRSKPIGMLPQPFVPFVLDRVSDGNLSGVDLGRLKKSASDALRCAEEDILQGIATMSNDEGVFLVDTEAGIVKFREPMYLAVYQQRKAADNSQATREAFISKFFEIMQDKKFGL